MNQEEDKLEQTKKSLMDSADGDVLSVRMSVRNLVEFILRSGDLDNRRSGADKDAMQQGSRLHRKIQGRMGSNYEAEYSIRYLVERPRFRMILEGRADGILTEEHRVVVDEIKAVYRDIHVMQEPVPVHLAQAKCYAFIYADMNKLESITVRMTYVQMETEELRYFYKTYDMEELKEWFLHVIAEYEKWAEFQADWQEIRRKSIERLTFPFPYRSQQKQLVAGVYRTIEQRKRLFLQASTGAGKTMSTVYPAVQAVGKGMADKIFYLTAKTITRTVALEAFEILAKQALQMKVIVLTAREKICFCEEPLCNPDACPYAKGHYDRINACVFELLQKENLITPDVIKEYAGNYRVCPFELSLDTASWVDVIICDYNYVFDYDVCLKRFFGEGNKEEYIFLIDEAHNLVDRAREMYSAELYKEEFLEVKRKVKFYSRKLEKLLDKCNKKLLEWKRTCENYDYMSLGDVGELTVPLVRLMAEMEVFMEEEEEEDIKTVVLDLYFKVRHFLNIFDVADEHYVVYKEFDRESAERAYSEKDGFKVRLFCVNPAGNLQNFLDKGRTAVFFSATLLPIDYYRKLLGGQTDDFAMYGCSPFDSRNRCVLVASDVSSRYSRRNAFEYGKIVDYLEILLRSKKGNYMIFLPSYVYMEAVYETFLSRNLPVRTLVQNQRMSEEEREAFIEAFSDEKEESLVGFCVLGGIFSEGIDLKENRLIGAVIVGTGMPQTGTEREVLQQYFQKEDGAGFDYAYRYPGFHKILQAAGRVIRTEKDRGVVILLEERLTAREYQSLYPREWNPVEICNRSCIEERLNHFWEGNMTE